tara:strand:- start:92 stop:643 length:552 start_codon:yes stop_codon:yes gene_type:complete
MAKGSIRTICGVFGMIYVFLAGFLGYFIQGQMEAGVQSIVCCFFSVILLVSGSEAKRKSTQQLVIYQQPAIQQIPVQQVVHHTHIHNQQTPNQKPLNISTKNVNEIKSESEWFNEARNLELARDWEKAAEAYQKAGMFSEAGRIRQQHLEKDDSQVKIHVDRIGHNIQDSVYMGDSDSGSKDN